MESNIRKMKFKLSWSYQHGRPNMKHYQETPYYSAPLGPYILSCHEKDNGGHEFENGFES